MSLTLAALDTRRSVPASQLAAPGPDDAQLLRLLTTAVRVPDHGKRVPFRFLRIQGEARAALSEQLVQRTLQRDPDASDATLDKERQRFQRAPVIVTVIAKQSVDDTIPASERYATAACVCLLLLQAAQAEGFGGQWLTGWMATDPAIRGVLGVGEEEAIVGFIHLGTPQLAAPERERPDPAALLTDWTPA